MKASKSDIFEKRGKILNAVEAYTRATVMIERENTAQSSRTASEAKFAVVKLVDELLEQVGIKC